MGSHMNQQADGAPARAEDDVRESLDALRRIVRLLRVSARASEKVVGVSGAQLFVLQQLADGGVCSIGELAERTLTHQSSVSVVVSRLMEQGLVSRQPSEADARRMEVALTPAGRALLSQAPPMAQAHLIAGLRRMAPEARAALSQGLSALVAQLGADQEQPPLFFEDEAPAPKRRPRSRTHEEA